MANTQVQMSYLVLMGHVDNRSSSVKATRGTSTDLGRSQSSPIRGGQHNATESSREDTDLLAHAASALRRLNFVSAGGSRSCRSVPKVMIMGSSTASETTINTSTDSANTMVTVMTTTDSEQHDDSMDLADEPSELSPPASSTNSILPSTKNGTNNSETITKNRTIAITQCTTAPMVQSPSIEATLNTNINSINGIDASSPIPAANIRRETKFPFTSGRIPALPDLRTAEFFSTPVRGSVDAGQPDPHQVNSMLTLLAAKQKISTMEETKANHIDTRNDFKKEADSQVLEKEKIEDSCGKMQKNAKPNINVTTNPLDISLCGSQSPCSTTQPSTGTRGSRKMPGGSSGGTKRTTQATIVVQQPSLTLEAPAATLLLRPEADARRREENMRQLLDVTHTLTLQEIHDFEMRYGSPHHSRSQSVKTPGSKSSGRPNYLCLPQQRSRVASMPNTGVEEEYYILRHFSITGKGIVNRGDSLKSRRSRSNNSVASSNSRNRLNAGNVPADIITPSNQEFSDNKIFLTEHLTASYPGSARNSAAGSLASSRGSSASQGSVPYKVLMLGAPAVGKSSLVSQFMTSEYLHAYHTSIDESGEKTVSVLLAGEESELTFIDNPSSEMTPENCITAYEPHAYCVVYSTTDRASARVAENVLQTLWRSDLVSTRAVILVGNKADLARSRTVRTEEGQSMAGSYDCKFIETSVGINHNVDELLVGLLTQIRLKLENPERTRDLFRKRSRKNRSRSPLGSFSENNSPKKYRGSRTSASLKVRNLLGKVWARDSKSKSCENLHVL